MVPMAFFSFLFFSWGWERERGEIPRLQCQHTLDMQFTNVKKKKKNKNPNRPPINNKKLFTDFHQCLNSLSVFSSSSLTFPPSHDIRIFLVMAKKKLKKKKARNDPSCKSCAPRPRLLLSNPLRHTGWERGIHPYSHKHTHPHPYIPKTPALNHEVGW
jgi:hypothetical protein